MPHPLDGAVARVARAQRHLDELDIVIYHFREHCERKSLAEYEARTREMMAGERHEAFRSNYLWYPVPIDVPILLSEVIHNLRAALDYLVFELAKEDSGVEQDGTQFIVEEMKSHPTDKNRGFDGRKGRLLKGLSPPHLDAVERLQPYNGVQWTKTLVSLSNPDKHRKLTAVYSPGVSETIIEADEPGTFDGRPGKVLPGVGQNGADVYVEHTNTVDVALDDGRLVMETLKDLQREVAATIDAFKPQFKV